MNNLNISKEFLQKLTLSKENVLELMYSCRVTPETKSPLKVWLYDESSSKTAREMQFDFFKLTNCTPIVSYFLGQLYAVHGYHRREHSRFLSIGEGIIDFTGKKWTDDNRAVLALYYMAIGSGIIAPFSEIGGSSKTELSDIIYPTFPCNHPDFDMKRAKLPLKRLGIQFPED